MEELYDLWVNLSLIYEIIEFPCHKCCFGHYELLNIQGTLREMKGEKSMNNVSICALQDSAGAAETARWRCEL